MSSFLLTANWTHLLVANFETDKKFLEQFAPAGTEVNDWKGKYIISLVGFEFSNPKFLGIPSPIYRNFPELNLRFYVKRKVKDQWRKGVVFIKEIAPARLIGLVAGWLYGENFTTLPLKKDIFLSDGNLKINYYLKTKNEINCLSALAQPRPVNYSSDTLETFILDHYWAYTKLGEARTNEFRVIHKPGIFILL